ncbi:hypothetical protein NLU13_9284 [Sarocladium strictum]|uniref:Uncharacterized protein n=1 Tax=Sarocladium strictum TaxID=5046 RepID=A0AA39L3Q3_SARSR|nr:hypothetical protein NLU13_9284 [Sarocladium strictum]
MKPTNYIPGRSLLLAPLALFVAPSLAQNNGGNNNNNNNDNSKTESNSASETGSRNSQPTGSSTSGSQTQSSTTEKPASSTTQASSQTTESSTSEEPTTTTDNAQQTDNDGPRITASLTRGFGIPTYPPAAVPPTVNAPFMQHSSAPDGTVFIAVGSILGAFGLGLLLWRVISGILLHRSVERAAMAQHDVNSKTGFPAPPAPFYKYTDQGSTMSLGGSAAGRGVRRTNRGPTPSNNNPSQSNLFFSPTAANPGTAASRGSSFLPSGFYAAGSSSPGPQGHGHSISLTNLRPDSRGHQGNPSRNTLAPSPPESPGVMARRDLSSSSLNLNQPPGQRAPSAYLDDLLADDPGAFPPPHMPPSQGVRHPSNLGNGANRF